MQTLRRTFKLIGPLVWRVGALKCFYPLFKFYEIVTIMRERHDRDTKSFLASVLVLTAGHNESKHPDYQRKHARLSDDAALIRSSIKSNRSSE